MVAAGPGDTVLVHDGTYGHESSVTGGDEADYAASPVVLRRSGDPAHWITIRAEHKWGAVLDCEMLCDSYIDLRNVSYVTIQDFVIANGYKEGIHSNDAAHHIVLRGNRIEHIANRPSDSPYGLDGLYTSPACHDFVIDDNVFDAIGRSAGRPNLDHGLYLRGENFTVTSNVFLDMRSGWAIQLGDGLSNIRIEGNSFAWNESQRKGQIMLWRKQTNVLIRNNQFHSPNGHAIARYDSHIDGSCVIDNNSVEGADTMILSPVGCRLRNNLLRR